MKHLSLILNAVLTVAVAILFYLHFSSQKPGQPITRSVMPVSSAKNGQQFIAYIDMDSLNEKVTYIKQTRAQMEAEQKSIENEVENGYRGLEQQKNEFLSKGTNQITQQEAEQFQAKLYEQQAAIDNKKQSRAQQLEEKNYKLMEDMQKKLKAFLDEYNNDKRFSYILSVSSGFNYVSYKDSAFDITNDVIKGLNERLGKSGQ